MQSAGEAMADGGFEDYFFGSQTIKEEDYRQFRFFMGPVQSKKNELGPQKQFSLSLETEIATNPQFFTNHNTGKKEILIQDIENTLYLISATGSILWKKALKGPIQGKIHEVDLYKNGKKQMAFTTNATLEVLDRNGDPVAPFPIDFDGGGLNGLAVFDYAQNRNYRFVVTQGNNILMYNAKGAIVRGFKYTKAENNVLLPPSHFRIGGRDYLVFLLEGGKVEIRNRVGKTRVSVGKKIRVSDNGIRTHKGKFLLTTEDGALVEIGTDGKITTNPLDLNIDHGMDATTNTLALINDHVLRIRGRTETLPLGVYTPPRIFYLNDKIYISVTDLQGQKIYLYDSQAQAIPNFPVYGSSAIDMGDLDNDKKPDFVVREDQTTIAVYEIQ